jgi:serine/threonine protein kinase
MLSIAHRDIKPQNILVDNMKHKLIISDFGSAKQLVKGKGNFI